MIYRNEKGNLVVEFSKVGSDAEAYHNRLMALVALIQGQDSDFSNGDDTYYAIELLTDMLPTHEQCKMFLKAS